MVLEEENRRVHLQYRSLATKAVRVRIVDARHSGVSSVILFDVDFRRRMQLTEYMEYMDTT